MALDKDKVQEYLDDFVIKNEDDINRVSSENPVLYNAIMDFVEVFSKKFGTAKTAEMLARLTPKKEEAVEPEKPKSTQKRIKNIYSLYEVKALSTPDKQVLTNEDGSKVYEYKDGVLYDTDPLTGKRTTSYRMSNIILNILPPKEINQPALPFKVGDFFYHKDNKADHYKIIVMDDNYVDVQLPNSSQTTSYGKDIVIQYFNSGTWVNMGYPYLKRQPISATTPTEQVAPAPDTAPAPETINSVEDEIKKLKEVIEGLELIAEFDSEAADELKSLKKRMKDLKKKKS